MIEIGRNSMVIRNADISGEGYKSFYRAYSIYDPVCHKYEQQVFFVRGSDIYMPASIGADYVRKYFPKDEISPSTGYYPKPRAANFSMIHYPRDAMQTMAMTFLERIKGDGLWQSRFLQLPTGSGKTFCTIDLACFLNVRAMVVVDTAELAIQWKKEFLNHTNMKEDDIAILSGRESVAEERKNSNRKAYIAIHKTLGMLMDDGDNVINSLMRDLGIGLRVFDEAHVDFRAICAINSFSNVEYTLYLTATPSRSNFREDNLYGKVFGRIPYFNGLAVEDDKYHTVVLDTFDSEPPIDVKAGIRTKRGFNIAKWSQYITSDDGYPKYKKFLFETIDKFKLLDRGVKIAIMLPTIDLIDKTAESLRDHYPGKADIGLFIGRIPKDDRSAELSHRIIITNDKIFDKGIDVEDLDVLMLFVPFSSKVKTEQVLGRLRHREGRPSVLIDVADVGFPECVAQQKLRRRVYLKKAKAVRSVVDEGIGDSTGK